MDSSLDKNNFCARLDAGDFDFRADVKSLFLFGAAEHGVTVIDTRCPSYVMRLVNDENVVAALRDDKAARVREFRRVMLSSPPLHSSVYRINGAVDVDAKRMTVSLSDVSSYESVKEELARKIASIAIGEGQKVRTGEK